MHRVLVVATAGAGGDLQPLMSAALALRDRGAEVVVVGDRSVERSLAGLGVPTESLPPELDLGPVLGGAIRDAMAATGGDLAAAGPMIEERMAGWAEESADPVARAVERLRPDAVMTSLFGVEAIRNAEPPCPWVVVNSTFYIGPNPPQPPAADFGPRALPLLSRYASLLESPDLVLHATDPVFDLSFDGLPERHHYVGPLGIWEPPGERPAFLDAPGDPWVLVSLSSQTQDDLPIAEVAIGGMADLPVRVIVTIGSGHDPAELADLPSNARVVQVVSHAAVLERGRLLLSHAGHGSVMKALWYGCPMVLVPWGRDQPGVAARAEALGVADVVLPDVASPDTIRGAASRVLGDPEIKERAERHAARLRSTDPPAVAAALIEDLWTG
jgi:UDP:flavonoid glycosyltransferase YjiC (YdhE family)